jgi:soluble lytic murein transglycosylase
VSIFNLMRLIALCFALTLFTFSNATANDVSAIKAASNKNYSVPASSQTGKTLVQWYKLRQSDSVSFREAKNFITSNPNWPDTTSIRKNAEENLNSSIPSREIITWFNQYPPLTAGGMRQYLNALISSNQTAKAMQTLKNWWPKAVMPPNDQDMIMDRFGQYLGSQDHERRLRSIIHDKHYTASRRLAKELGNGYPQLVEAKIGLIEQKSNVNELVAAVPASLRNNEALMLARVQWRRKNDQDTGAIELLSRAPAHNRLSDPKSWWRERHIMARRLMEQGKWGSAYKLVSDHRQKDGFSNAQAEFLSGWLALRKIGKPWDAFKHFEKLFNAVESPISRARGAYWAGLASDTLGHPEIAMQWYQVAAKHQTTFYGQMAAQRINLPLGLLRETPIQITQSAQDLFKRNSFIVAATILNKAGLHRDSKRFLETYADYKKTGLAYNLSAQLSQSYGYNDNAVRIAKAAEREGYLMPSYLFPVLPAARTGRYAVHPAFNHGIIRQESAFDQYAKSHAGALGLMQLMPPTARETAGKAGLPYSKSRLTSDPAYNMTLGSLYIKQMLDRFDGNRTLAIAAYNAGPGRVSRWLKEIGDPRDPNIDEADWIESIPVYETRNYVHRVTEAVNVYANLLR